MSWLSSGLAKIGISKDFQRKATVGAVGLATGVLGAKIADKLIPQVKKPAALPAPLPPPTAKLEPVPEPPLVRTVDKPAISAMRRLGTGGFRNQLLLPRIEPSRIIKEQPLSLDVNRDRPVMETETVVTPPAVLRAQGDTPMDPATMLQDGGGMKKWLPLIAIILLLVALFAFSRKK